MLWFVYPAEKLHEAYNSSGAYPVYKNIVRFDGDHNHPRPAFFYSSVCCFFHQQLKLELVLMPGHSVSMVHCSLLNSSAAADDWCCCCCGTQQLLQHGSLSLSGLNATALTPYLLIYSADTVLYPCA
jgi:hypothetical protein